MPYISENPEMVSDARGLPPNCSLLPYTARATGSLRSKGPFIAYASPDSTYAVTKKFVQAAKKSILIGIYDFSAAYMRDLLLEAMGRGVKVTLMLDLDRQDRKEGEVFQALTQAGVRTVAAPSCTHPSLHYFRHAHEKFIVIDGLWTLVQSGNYSENSIPQNEADGADPAHFKSGNRDMGVAIKSKTLAKFFSQILEADIALEQAVPSRAVAPMLPQPAALVERIPRQPPRLFPSQQFKPSQPIQITPVLSPDNYLQVIPAWLEQARRSIWIEQQYIRPNQPGIKDLLQAIQKARRQNPSLEVRIVLGKVFLVTAIASERANLEVLKQTYDLELGQHIRYINTANFVHCHNKTVVVDGEAVLVSSQNWSADAVAKNREAGLLLEYPDLARYYASIIEADWNTALHDIPPLTRDLISAAEVAQGGFVELSLGDYLEV